MTFRASSKFGRFLVLAGLIHLAASGLLAQQVTYNFMPGTDFSKYHTFKWVDIPSNVHPNQIVSQEIKEAVNNVLASKGLTQATGDTADLYVGYQCSVDQERQWNALGERRKAYGGDGISHKLDDIQRKGVVSADTNHLGFRCVKDASPKGSSKVIGKAAN